jgi:hypothetical protein
MQPLGAHGLFAAHVLHMQIRRRWARLGQASSLSTAGYRSSERAEENYVFIPARVTDNPVLMRDKSYLITLETCRSR